MMTCKSWALWAFFALVQAMSVASHAAPNEPESARFTIIVANNHSRTQGVGDLRYADDDGALYWRALRPFSERITLLTLLDHHSQRLFPDAVQVARAPRKRELREALDQTYRDIEQARRAGRRTDLIFIFVGHGGVEDDGRGFLHLADGRLTRKELRREILQASPADMTHVVIDACNALSVVAGRGNKARANEDPVVRFLAGHDLDEFPNVGVLAATSPTREVYEWGRIQSGVFSHQVRSALLGGADVNSDGAVEYSEVAAFVDAANAAVEHASARTEVFAWPPRRNLRAPLISYRRGDGLRSIVVRPDVAGKWFIETKTGTRWASFHKAPGETLVLAVPKGIELFVRGEIDEFVVGPEVDRIVLGVDGMASQPLTARGAAESALTRGLFGVPFDQSYYRGFVSAQRRFVPVELEAPSESRDAKRSSLSVAAAYMLEPFAITPQALSHGLVARVSVHVTEHTAVSVGLETSVASVQRGGIRGAWRGAATASVACAYALWRTVHGLSSISAGFGFIDLRGSIATRDLTVPMARIRTGLSLPIGGPVALQLAATGTAYLPTILGRDKVMTTIGTEFGIAF